MQVIIESIYIAIQTTIYAFFLYPMIGFEWTAAKFLWFYYFLFMSFIYFTLFGMMTMSLTPTPQISAVLVYFITCLWNLFSGFIIPRPVCHFLHPTFFTVTMLVILILYFHVNIAPSPPLSPYGGGSEFTWVVSMRVNSKH